MKEKEIKIVPPEGYEIDRENSSCDVIKFKPIKKDLTYKDICDKIFSSQCLYTTSRGDIISEDLKNWKYDKNSSTTEEQLQKVLAINQLYNIAKYYNEDWMPDWSLKSEKVYVIKSNEYNKYSVWCWDTIILGCVCFKNRSDAQAVIDNPNFKDILDTIFK